MKRYKEQMDKYVRHTFPIDKHWDIAGLKHISWMNKLCEILPDWAKNAVDYRYLNTFDLF